MKKIYLLVFLLISGVGFSQASYTIEFKNLTYKVSRNVKNNTSSHFNLILNYSDGTSTNLYTSKIGDDSSENNYSINSFPTNKIPKSITYDLFVNFSSTANISEKFDINIYPCVTSNSYSKVYDGMNVSFNYDIRPNLNVIQPELGVNNFLPVDEDVIISSNTGFIEDYYNWEYSVNSDPTNPSGWVALPQYATKASFTTNAKAILGVAASSYHGRKIFFRQKACNTKSTPVEYSIRLSTPKILSAMPENVSCYDLGSQDGKLKIQFDRPLYPNENLSIDLLFKGSNINREHLILNPDNSYLIEDLSRGDYELRLIGNLGLGTLNTYSPTANNPIKFTIEAPKPLDFTLHGSDILCNGAQNGEITITPTGGTRNGHANDFYSLDNGVTWIPFFNGSPYTLTGLSPGKYAIKIKDMNGCIARTQTLVNGNIELGEEKIIEATISQPTSPLRLNYTFKKDPTFYGAANGKLVASISGGTINDDQSYWYEWKNSTGVVLPTAARYNSADKSYNITLENVPAGEYKLIAHDKNYDAATNKEGCSVIESSQILIQPEKIKIILEETQPISCHTESLDPLGNTDKKSDGIITATVSGGIPFTGSVNNGLPYKFVWSKYNTVTNLWDELSEYKTETAINLSQGNYSLNVEDSNGIVQGAYNTTDLVTAIPTTKAITEPTKLELSFTSGNVSCNQGNNGWATVNVTGGAGSYKYAWYNVNGGIIDKNRISQLTAGTYTVEVTDKNGCFTTGNIEITEPQSPVAIEYEEIFTPSFSGATDGRIVAKITGGTPNDNQSYGYEWKNSKGELQAATAELKNGIYTITINNLPANDYFLTIKDKNYNEAANQIVNCSKLDSKVTLSEPDPLKVVFEIVRSISCNTSNEFGNDTDTTPKDGQRDESQDGILVAHVTGGTALATSANNGLPYYFYWKKQQADGSWIPLPMIKDSIASSLSHGNYALNIKDRNGIVLGTYVNNKLTQEVDVTQLMQEPPKLAVTITHGDVFCNGGNDGWATANVTGGTPPYDYKWSNDFDTDKNTILKAGDYWVFVTDAKGCTTQADVTITEPTAPLVIKYTETLNPSFYKATNGKIVVEVTGGTIFSDNSYWFEWKNSKGIVQNTTAANFSNGIYTISLNGLGEETYSLTVHDANYNAAVNKTSCTVANSVVTLDDPDPLEVTFEVVRTISCNVGNEFGNETDMNPQDSQRDESQDGILVAHVKGGIQLPADKNNGLPYFYTWKKQQKDGSWIIWNDKDETAENISDGIYALNVEDANGIKLGTYVNNILVKEIDITQFMPEPAKLNLTFTKLNASCNSGDDGWAEAHVSGGTAPYTYEWTNGETTSKIENITTNNYFVVVTDSKGCTVQGSIFVGDPKGILATETVKNPTCFQGNDGSIQLNVTGGNLPYSYLWNTGATTKDLNNVAAGNYDVTISCPDCCVFKRKFTLKNPNPIVVNLGKDRTLCNDQVLDLDVAIADAKAQYNWTSTNGFTSNQAKVSLTKAGTYHVKVTSALGCVGEDDIVIKTNKVEISSEFLLSSEAYLDEEVVLVNISEPFGESTNWVIPNGVKIIEQKEKYITLKFDKIGTYTIGLEQTQGECFATYNKNITVEKRSTLPNAGTTTKSIIDFIVTPNPSNGNFKAIVNLENNSAVNLRLFSTTGEFTTQKKDSGKKNYEVDFNTSLQSGMYILVLETEQQTLVKKIIIY